MDIYTSSDLLTNSRCSIPRTHETKPAQPSLLVIQTTTMRLTDRTPIVVKTAKSGVVEE